MEKVDESGWFLRKGHRKKAGVELIELSKNFTL
jgi:hypothetical protein